MDGSLRAILLFGHPAESIQRQHSKQGCVKTVLARSVGLSVTITQQAQRMQMSIRQHNLLSLLLAVSRARRPRRRLLPRRRRLRLAGRPRRCPAATSSRRPLRRRSAPLPGKTAPQEHRHPRVYASDPDVCDSDVLEQMHLYFFWSLQRSSCHQVIPNNVQQRANA